MTFRLRIALRDWDYITPLLLGDVRSDRLSLEIDRVNTLIGDVSASRDFDAAEQSFSRYAQIMHDDRDDIVGIPVFIMRGFRHRCVITTRNSPLKSLADLKGKAIGVTGWRDSGNTWTRAALRREGVETEDARWFAGRLTAEHPITNRLDGFGRPGLIEACPGERPMTELLSEGFLDAVFTPFMPTGFIEGTSHFRQVVDDFVAAETRYFHDVGYVPGMHLLGVKAAIIDANPWLPEEITRMIDESCRMWTTKRRKYADTTPFMLDELRRSAMALPENWQDNGFAANRTMIADFARELHEQKILPRLLSPEDLFPRFA